MLRTWRKWSRGEKVFPRVPSHHTLVSDMIACGIPSVTEGKRGQWHRFRKGLCSQLAVQSVDPENRRRMMRHKDTAITTDIYTDSEIVENSTIPGGILELLPKLNGFRERCLTKRVRIADTSPAECRASKKQLVTEKSPVRSHWPGLSNRSGRAERGSSPSPNDADGGMDQRSRGESTLRHKTASILAAVLDAQIEALSLIRTTLRREAGSGIPMDWSRRGEN